MSGVNREEAAFSQAKGSSQGGPLSGVGGQILRRPTLLVSCENKIKTDRTAELIGVVIRQHAVLKTGREQDQQPRAGCEIPVGLVQRMVFINRTAISDGQASHQLVGLIHRMQTEYTLGTRTSACEIEHSTEMGIRVMVPSNRLIPFTDHRPATLQMQRNLVPCKSSFIEIGPGVERHLLRQCRKRRMPMQLPHTIEISCPGTSIVGITVIFTAQGQQRLEDDGLLQRIDRQLSRGDHRGKQLMMLKHAIPKTNPSSQT